ncbi:MAG TPA: 50S ribosomal protein L17, partial [Acidimicrobiia bacterium]|nr:50S ribosomal protein L17 [Acidimicrobiia bacterium]
PAAEEAPVEEVAEEAPAAEEAPVEEVAEEA